MQKYLFHINLYDLCFLGIIFIGLTFSCLLWFTKLINRSANLFLGTALFVVVIWMVSVLSNDIGPGNGLQLKFSMAFGPLIYFYVLKITKPGYKIQYQDLLHFGPIFLEMFLPQFKTLLYGMAFISVIVYLFLSHRLIENFYRQLKFNEVNDRYRSQLRWLNGLLRTFCLLWLIWIPYALVNYFQPLPISAFYPFYIILSANFIRISIVCFFKEDISVPNPVPVLSKPLIPAELMLKGVWLKELMEKNLYYREPELSLRSLAATLDLSANELSRIVNSTQHKSFNDFINGYRVAEVVRKMQDPAYNRLTLIGIAMDAGFNSKSTFNRIFKEMTRKSPAEFKRDLQNKLPSYTLRPHRPYVPINSGHEANPLWLQRNLKRNYMYKTYFKTAWRNITGNKLFTALNLSGLSIGICVCITLFACAAYELSFDKMYKNSKDIYRINMQASAEFDNKVWAQLPGLGGPTIAGNLPQVKSMTRLLKYNFGGPVSIKTDDKTFNQKGLYMADPAILDIFDFTFIEGNERTAFAQVKNVIISESAKQRLYGKQPAIGKFIYADNRDTFHVSGVYKDLPQNSTIDCDMIYNIMDTWFGKQAYWGNSSYETYCLLQHGSNPEQVQKQATALIDKFVARKDQFFIQFLFQPLASIHLHSADIRAGFSSRIGSIGTVNALIYLSLLVLGIACINYMNLSTARLEKRAKGVGVNKVLGADRRHLLKLFYTETALLSFMAILFGYGASFIMQVFFEDITGIALQSSAMYSVTILFGLLLTWVTVTVIAGSYPALYLSRISPLVLMNKLKINHKVADIVRKGLVVFQFSASIILVISVLIVLEQINYIQNKDLGYNPRAVVAVPINSAQNYQQVSGLLGDLKTMSEVESATPSQSIPGNLESGKMIKRLSLDNDGYPVKTCNTNGSIVKTMDLKLLAGKSIPEMLPEKDSLCYLLINESVSRYLGYKTPQDAIGRYANTEMDHHAIISGVVKDFNYESLKNDIGGYVYYIMNKRSEPLNTLLIRYNTKNIPVFMQQLQRSFKTNLPNASFDYEFLDTHLQSLYKSEQHTGRTVIVFSMLAIFIACLGLYGLAASVAEQRTKEIGIRKVLGASVAGITRLLTKDFVILVLIAIFIASPVAWYMMTKWLTGFSYRITINAWAFVIAGALSMILALLTVSSHAIRAAVLNPVKSLRDE